MPTAEKLGDESGNDKVTEKRMAELPGTTPKALQRKRRTQHKPSRRLAENRPANHVQQMEV